jgi:hypothetical protein
MLIAKTQTCVKCKNSQRLFNISKFTGIRQRLSEGTKITGTTEFCSKENLQEAQLK